MDASDELLRKPDPAALLTPDGVISDVNAAMASMLGSPAEQCRGRSFGDLLPANQRLSAESLVAHAVKANTVVMRVLDFPGPGRASVACLIEARPMTDPVTGENLVWVHSLDARNDLTSLLIPFRMATSAGDIGLWMYSSHEHNLEWLGGAPAVAGLFKEPTARMSRVMSAVHPDDREALRQLVCSVSARSPWLRMRYLTERDGWHQLSAQARRIQLGYGGPERIFVLVRDDTRHEKRKEKARAALAAERQRAKDTGDFSSALITAATEQELQQVVLTRLAATYGACGALLALVDDGRLRVSTDAGVDLWDVETMHGLRLDHPSPVPEAIRTGKYQFITGRGDYLSRWPHGAGFPRLGRLGYDYAVMITPLGEAGNAPLGAWVMAYGKGYQPSLDEQTLMRILADLAGQALRRIRSQQARVELATALQRTMLPTLPQHLPGLEVAARYRPSHAGLDIGGDWYDVFEMPGGGVVLEIGDAQGHDVDAAALMGQMRLFMRAIAEQGRDPATVLMRTNEQFLTAAPARFASCSLLHIDPRNGQVTGASAGHVPVLCARRDGSHTVRELPGGPVLGVVPDTDYREETFTLDEDSALVLVTDGVVEGPGLTLDAGLERVGSLAGAALRDGLNAEETADRILDDAVTVDHLDDVTVLVIRRT